MYKFLYKLYYLHVIVRDDASVDRGPYGLSLDARLFLYVQIYLFRRTRGFFLSCYNIILMFEVVCEDGLTNLKYVPNAVYYRVYLLKVGVSYKLIKINVIVKITDRSAIKCFLRNLILWKIAQFQIFVLFSLRFCCFISLCYCVVCCFSFSQLNLLFGKR